MIYNKEKGFPGLGSWEFAAIFKISALIQEKNIEFWDFLQNVHYCFPQGMLGNSSGEELLSPADLLCTAAAAIPIPRNDRKGSRSTKNLRIG